LEEHFLVLPNANHRDGYIRVHPEFRAIFTSNPQEYAGVHDAQDALSDRLLTMDLEYFNRETEIHITTAKSGMSEEDVYRIVDIVRDFRASGEYDQTPTMRSSIMIAKIASQEGLHPSSDDPRFITLCLDILESKTSFTSQARERRAQQRKMLLKLIEHHSKDENL